METILVMGGSDFIGSALTKYLINCGYKVEIFNSKPVDLKGKELTQLVGDRRNIEEISSILKGKKYKYIYDLRANSKEDVRNLIESVDIGDLSKYIVLSSGAVYKDSTRNAKENHEKGENDNWGKYGLNKKEAEDFIMGSNLPYIIIRPTYIYGENNNLYREYYFFDRILNEKEIPVPCGKHVNNQFIYIEDLVRVLESLMRVPHVREAYNVTNPQVISWNELIETCSEIVGKSAIIKYIDGSKIGLRERSFFPFRNINYNLDIDKLIEHGLYIPNILLKEGLEKTYKWYLENKPSVVDNKMNKVEQVLNVAEV